MYIFYRMPIIAKTTNYIIYQALSTRVSIKYY